jgi:hypothetical protein
MVIQNFEALLNVSMKVQPIRGLRDTIVNSLALTSSGSSLRNMMFCIL